MVDGAALREIMRQFAAGVTVVTAYDAARRPVGATVSAFTSLSLTPPLALVCLTETSRTVQAIRDSGAFAVHLLEQHQSELASRFAADQAEKFQPGDLAAGDGAAAPILQACGSRLVCSRHAEFAGGDHLIVVGLVEAVSTAPGYRPLVHQDRAFWQLHPLRED